MHPFAAAAALALGLPACEAAAPPDTATDPVERPNVLVVLWDTVRADRLSLYGHERATTPHLDAWARDARVYENALSVASTTIPSHGSLFTGLLPVEHGAHDERRWLDDAHETLAERLRDAGYRTYLWSANPHVASDENFQQGFEHEAHPWDDAWRDEALRIVRSKVEGDRSSELAERLRRDDTRSWTIKAAGALAERDLLAWLEAGDAERPWFAFVNYMEAHRPFIPDREHREALMTPEEVARSYRVDLSWWETWAYTFGLREYDAADLRVAGLTYDAALHELDALFASLLAALEAGGHLDDTVVVLTADHGELLGDHHMLDHQYALWTPLLRVPLVVHDPGRFEPGRDARPVQSFDLFPTILELAGLDPPRGLHARSLRRPAAERVRVAEYPAAFESPIRQTRKRFPDWDPTPWEQPLRALRDGPHALVSGPAGPRALYDLVRDPEEAHDLAAGEPELAARLHARLDAYFAELEPWRPDDTWREAPLSEEQRRRLEGLGYLLDEGEGAAE